MLDGFGDCYDATSAADGSYSVAVASSDTYQVQFTDNDNVYASGWYDSAVATTQYTSDYSLATDVVVDVSDVPGINIRLPLAVHITGTVTGPGATPLSGIDVWTCSTGYGSCYDATSVAGGSYSVAVAPSDTYQMSFTDYSNVYASGYYDSAVPSTHYTADSSLSSDVVVGVSDVPGINIRLPLAVHITGTVTGPGSVPLSGIDVTACSTGYGSCGEATSAANGSYSVAVAPSDTYQVEFTDYDNVYASGWYDSAVPTTHYTSDSSSATDVVVGVSDVPGINIRLPLAVHITGTVTGPGATPLSGIDVSACTTTGASTGAKLGGNSVYPLDTTGGYCYDAMSAANGSYSVAVPPSQSYQIQFNDYNTVYVSGWYDSAVPTTHYTADSSSATDVVVGVSDVPGINITLPLLVHITGTVTGPGSVPLAGIDVWACSTGFGSCGDATSAANGSYSVAVAPSDTYQVEFTDYDNVYVRAGMTARSLPPLHGGLLFGDRCRRRRVRRPGDQHHAAVRGPHHRHRHRRRRNPARQHRVSACTTGYGSCGGATSAADGSYSVAVAPSDTYQMSFYDYSNVFASGWYDSAVPTTHYTPDPRRRPMSSSACPTSTASTSGCRSRSTSPAP